MNFLRHRIQAADDSGVEPGRDRNSSGRDETKPPGTSGGLRVTNGASLRIYAIIAVVAFSFGSVNAFSTAHDIARRGGVYDLGKPLLWELTSVAVILALTPLIDFGVRYARHATSWPLRIGWAAGTIVIFSALHIVGMVMLRKLAMATVGGSYDFGFTLAELVYESRKDAVTCLMIGAVFWLAGTRREALAEKAAESASSNPKPPDVLWLRDGSARIRVEPGGIVWVSSAGNYIEYGLADGRTHLIRGTLAAEEARLIPFNIVRVHRTRLVNLSRVRALKAGLNRDFELTLDTGQVISGSRRYRGAVTSIDEVAANTASVSTGSGAAS